MTLEECALDRNFKEAKKLIENGAPLQGSYILHSAIEAGNLEFVQWLIQHREDVDLSEKKLVNFGGQEFDIAPLTLAVLYANREIFKILHPKGCNLKIDEYNDCSTKFYYNHLKVIENSSLSVAEGLLCYSNTTHSIVNGLLEHTYSDIFTANALDTKYTQLLSANNDIVNEILHANSLNIGTSASCLLLSDTAFKQTVLNLSFRGYYIHPIDTIGINTEASDSFGSIVHEYTHRLMRYVFGIKMTPYPQHSLTAQSSYNQAVIETLFRISQELFNISDFTELETNDSFKFGQSLLEQKFAQLRDDLSTTQKHDLYQYCLKTFSSLVLRVYGYAPQEEHAEFVVRLPQLIATEPRCYDALKEGVAKPMDDYWKAEISPAVQELIATHDTSTHCASEDHTYLA